MYPTLLVGSILLLVSATGEEHLHTSRQAHVSPIHRSDEYDLAVLSKSSG
jgi:hypothetical protein